MKKVIIATGLVIALLIGGFYLLNAYIYAEKQGSSADVQSYRGALTGEVVCLPHIDTDGPTTLECAMGLQTAVGEYYALNFMLMSQQHQPVVTGDRLTANGVITPRAMLDTEWDKYDIDGMFSVTDSVEML